MGWLLPIRLGPCRAVGLTLPFVPNLSTRDDSGERARELIHMFKGKRIIAIVPAHNEQQKIVQVVARTPREVVDCLVVVDDGSTDDTAPAARAGGALVHSLSKRAGVGAALRTGLQYARSEGFDVAVIMAGNNKDNPAEISRLLGPICDGACDLVVGSRYLAGGRYGGDMPVYCKVATRIHPWLLSLAAGKKLTETTNGFRALRLSCLDDPRINLQQGWLDGYALEVYLLYKMITLGYRHVEVPCTKIYPPKNLGYTKMTPLVGWWDILQPVFLLGLRIKR
ncbi:MAG TPA: glycosyltransferase family 2 protein [Planctomycetaceae bacterium]|nr:glycosyltransferase family 2 protein [Planctomycetaceae bacterium]